MKLFEVSKETKCKISNSKIMKIKFVILLSLVLAQFLIGQTNRFSPEQIVEDFEYLYKTLDASHYDLYTNITKRSYDKEFKRILGSINDSMTSMQAFRILQPFVALDKHAHCQVLPFNNYGEYYEQGGTVFPINLCFRNNKAYVLHNFSSDSTISKGDEITSINGKSLQTIKDEMFRFFSGETNYLKNTFIEMLTFPRLYWVVYGRNDEFNLVLRNNAEPYKEITVSAITAEEFEAKNEAQKPLMNNNRDFHFINNIAYLHPGNFQNHNAKNEFESSDTREFTQFIDSAFVEIHQSRTQNLIIDLRNNPGGINNFSDYMLSFISDTTFRFSEKFMVRTSMQTKEFWKDEQDSTFSDLKNAILSKEDGTRFIYKLPINQPRTDSLHFTGNVYVLINRYDFSQAVLTAAMIQDYKMGILIGEQTADNSSLFGSAHTFNLPNTGLQVMYPKAFVVRPNGDEDAKGVIPDYHVEENLFNDNDEILDFALKLIEKSDD